MEITAEQLDGLVREVAKWDGDVARISLKAGPVRDVRVELSVHDDAVLDNFTLRYDGERFETIVSPA